MSGRDRLERFRHRYIAVAPGWIPATALLQRRVAAVLSSESKVLDLGCGRGGIVERLGGQGWWVGVDPDMTSLRQHRLPALCRVRAGSEQIPFASETLDVVVASWVLEHLPCPKDTFREVARVMRPGGSFFFLTPNAAHPLPRLSSALSHVQRLQRRAVAYAYKRVAADTFPVAYRANTVQEIERLAVETGLRLAEIRLVDDPSYFAWNDLTFIAALFIEMLLPAGRQVHLVGEFRKLEDGRYL